MFSIIFYFSLHTQPLMLAISGGDFHIWSMSFILFCIFMWNKLILWRKFLLFFEVEYFVILLLKMSRFFKCKA